MHISNAIQIPANTWRFSVCLEHFTQDIQLNHKCNSIFVMSDCITFISAQNIFQKDSIFMKRSTTFWIEMLVLFCLTVKQAN